MQLTVYDFSTYRIVMFLSWIRHLGMIFCLRYTFAIASLVVGSFLRVSLVRLEPDALSSEWLLCVFLMNNRNATFHDQELGINQRFVSTLVTSPSSRNPHDNKYCIIIMMRRSLR